MKILQRPIFQAVGMVLLVGGILQGCSSVAPLASGRKGLIDRMAEEDRFDRDTGSENDDDFGARVAGSDSQDAQMTRGRVQRLSEVGSTLSWPLHRVQVTSPFGRRASDFHEGVDLRAHSGTPVFASGSGTVIYAGQRIRGYGKLVVIRHNQGVSTVYAHNSQLLVHRGERVSRGQKIATSGATGHVKGPHVHFEIRDGVVAVNPSKWVTGPKLGHQAARSTASVPVPIPTKKKRHSES